MSLVTQVQALATGIANYIRDSILPRVIPTGGTTGQYLYKTSSTNYQVGWVTPFSGAYTDLTGKPTLFTGAYADLTGKPTLGTAAAKNITVGTTAPSSPAVGDVWIDTN